ncbi:hypothetical protein PRUPE_3G157800 [Prunus persica]|uniref:Uncharacterized protein n=1 Tax=Prunus persica TaxID=3760 RepID=A0A251Q0Q6_PRUPE|nr:hypothetical protein PRUPE_3G157800 [Prunus persica]
MLSYVMALSNAASELMRGAQKLSSLLDESADWDSRMQTRCSNLEPNIFLCGVHMLMFKNKNKNYKITIQLLCL